MLKNIDPLLTPELLQVLRAMGHGDELVLADANFPAASMAKRLIRLDGVDLIEAGRAVLSVFPLDGFVDTPVYRMEVIGQPDEIPPVQQEFQQITDQAAGRSVKIAGLERFAFYERARQAYAVVLTGERRGYGNAVLVKGVIGPDGEVVWL